MLRKISMLTLIACMLSLVVELPASANSVPTTGSRISVLTGPYQYPANTPFYVEHGFGCFLNSDAANCATASTSFVLFVDGVQQPSRKDVDQVSLDGVRLLGVGYLTNFPQGLTVGAHTFIGVWYLNGSFFQERTITVTFT